MASPSAPDLDVLFPAPSPLPPSPLCPTILAGPTDDSVQTLRDLLKLNCQSHHIFLNDLGFHNHMLHHLLTKFALGANSNLLRAMYDYDKDLQRPAYPSPGPITAKNYIDHLGNEDYYQSYFTFFATCVLDKGVFKTLEEYVYSKRANYDDQRGQNQPRMFSRFIGGLYHPFIHLGYGLEFGMVGVVAEALAQAAVHGTGVSNLIPPSSWDDEKATGDVDNLASRMSSLALSHAPPEFTGGSSAPSAHAEEITVFNILELIQKDDSMSTQAIGITENTRSTFQEVMEKLQEPIRKYADMWTLNIVGSSHVEREVERKIEELAWACALMYVGGWSGDKSQPFRADFGLMHLVTSSLFFPPVVAYFPPHATQLLFRSYLATALALWITKRKPVLHIKEFMASTSTSPQGPTGAKSPHQPAKDSMMPETASPNPWLPLTESVLKHPDEHVCKIQRSLMHWARLFGSRPAGYWAGGKEQLKDIELLDGTLFIRVAGLTVDALGWMKEGQEQGEWDFSVPPGIPARIFESSRLVSKK